MKIKSIKIKNFRSYKEETVIYFDDLTVLVGKNDIGKSTILEALDIFFNDGNGIIKIDKADLNIQASRNGDNETIISVCFSELPESIIIDSTVQTTLDGEYMLNSEGDLEVVKKYKSGGKASVFIRAKHPTNAYCKDLLLKKNADLRHIITGIGIACENQSANAIMRKAIWEYYAEDLNLQDIEIDVSKEDAKRIWDKLSSYMPVYSLFQSDRKNSDGDSEVQDPLKEAVKQIINDEELQQTLALVAEIVETKLQEVSSRTLEKLREMDPAVASSLNPVIPTADKLKWADVFKSVSISGDEDIPINKRGSGVKRLVLLNFFRAEAERRAEEGDNTGIIYAIEEPETSQHSNNQRVLIKALKELAQAANTQILLTTHSPVIVKELDFENLRLIYEDENEKCVRSVEPAVLQYPSLNEVNYIAYGEITEEYHNELYGFLEFQQWLNDYKNGRPQRAYLYVRNGNTKNWNLDLSEYIRNQIHHPENHSNAHFTRDELKQSIEDMRNYIRNRAEAEGIWEPIPDAE
jgi:predicted ATP-dependent endonuclease of OLD family